MTVEELQREYTTRIDPTTKTVTMLPDDIILNTRRAFNTDPTSLTGYGSLGAPTGRYLAPIGGPGCVAIQTGECGDPKRIFVRAPAFTRIDMTLRKRFPWGGTRSFDVQIDALNVFDAINFTPVFNPGNGATIFQVTSAYTDLSNSYDPGGRLGQIVFRVNW